MNIKVENIYIVRAKRLSSKRSVTRSSVRVKAVNTSVKVVDAWTHELTVEFDHPKIEGVLLGKLDPTTGTVKMDSSSLQLKGYLKSRRFKVTGYDLSASRVNTIKRKRKV